MINDEKKILEKILSWKNPLTPYSDNTFTKNNSIEEYLNFLSEQHIKLQRNVCLCFAVTERKFNGKLIQGKDIVNEKADNIGMLVNLEGILYGTPITDYYLGSGIFRCIDNSCDFGLIDDFEDIFYATIGKDKNLLLSSIKSNKPFKNIHSTYHEDTPSLEAYFSSIAMFEVSSFSFNKYREWYTGSIKVKKHIYKPTYNFNKIIIKKNQIILK